MSMPIATMLIRMKPLPRRHRIAHLRALIRREQRGSIRHQKLLALLRDEMSPEKSNGVTGVFNHSCKGVIRRGTGQTQQGE